MGADYNIIARLKRFVTDRASDTGIIKHGVSSESITEILASFQKGGSP